MDHDKEITALAAETLALQTILTSVLNRLGATDPRIGEAIRGGFDDAASFVENMAIKFGKSASPEHSVKALGIVEQLRTATLGEPDKPKHGV